MDLVFDDHHLNLSPEWYHDPQNKCYTNFDTGDSFYYSEELLCFVGPPPPVKAVDLSTNIKMRHYSSATATREPFQSIANEGPILETTHQQGEFRVPKERKRVRCGFCLEEGHNRRSCRRAP